jgi:hypothetical protein
MKPKRKVAPMERNRVGAEQHTNSQIPKEGSAMTSRQFSRKRIGQALGLVALGLVLLVGGSGYGQSPDNPPPIAIVNTSITSSGGVDAELFPDTRVKADFAVDCSDPNPLNHKLLQPKTPASLLATGTPNQPLTAQTITSLRVSALSLFTLLTPADFTITSSGGTTIITPKLKTSTGRTKFCMVSQDKEDPPKVSVDIRPELLILPENCTCKIKSINITVGPKRGGTAPAGIADLPGYHRIEGPLDSELTVKIDLEGTGNVQLDLKPLLRSFRLARLDGSPPSWVWDQPVALNPDLLLDADARETLNRFERWTCRDIEFTVTLHDLIVSGEVSMPGAGGGRERVIRPDRNAVGERLADRSDFPVFLDVGLQLGITVDCPPPRTLSFPIGYGRGPFLMHRRGDVFYINPPTPRAGLRTKYE